MTRTHMEKTTFAVGSKVNFLPGPRASLRVTGTVKKVDGEFLVVDCTDGKTRKIRPGSCRAA